MKEYQVINSDNAKVCPKCGYNYVSPVAVYVSMGNQQMEVTSDNITLHRYIKPVDQCRGVIVTREFVCENGHRWLEIEQFHKGETFTETQIITNEGPNDVIWRD